MKKTKRYQEGGSAEEDKKRGLEASKDEKVGFIERLRMGNIDDPKSEAYKRFGAGRGAVERAKSMAPAPQSIRATDSGKGVPGFGAPMLPKPVEERAPSSMPPALRSAVEGAGVGEGGKAPVVKGPDQPVPRPKKQPKKASGYKIDEEGPAKIGNQNTFNFDLRKKAASPKTSELESEAADRDRKRKALLATAGAATLGAMASGLRGRNKRQLEELDSGLKASGGRYGGRQGKYIQEIDPMFTGSAGFEQGPMKKGGKVKAKPVKKYASGGMVCKASKRADGIAKKGKTKGRII
jgi:hypothetical protein